MDQSDNFSIRSNSSVDTLDAMDIIESTRALSSEEAQIRPSMQRKAQCLFIALELRDLEELKLRCVDHVVLVDQDLIRDVVSMGIDSLVTYMDANVDKFRPNSMMVDRGRRSVGLILDFNKNALFTRIEVRWPTIPRAQDMEAALRLTDNDV
ncbi:hypothetical protein CTRI78_v002708 [Colletotrichum trifolii]|uniref:Uncharacterized protein n=1 Tax=Colletotrichum trifolii TaxID=5466 RepID=A0A4R8RX33_COLTR|nr:hypothetical protein CTRI78_v002708 [Colletotrichum trifolii]